MSQTDPHQEQLHGALRRWFDAGHSRFAIVLSGSYFGRVAVAHDRGPANPPEIIIRQVLSDRDGKVIDRIETPDDGSLARDELNRGAILEAISARLAGRVDPPSICPRTAPRP